MTYQTIEEIIRQYPICQYGFLKTEALIFSEKVRYICEQECERYQKSWSCPPAVGTLEECKKKCMAFDHVFIFTTLAEVEDSAILSETLGTRKQHEAVTRALCDEFLKRGESYLALSSESCALCKNCTWPLAPCRHPDQMVPCIESYGVLVTDTASLIDIHFFYDSKTITWFGMIFFHRD